MLYFILFFNSNSQIGRIYSFRRQRRPPATPPAFRPVHTPQYCLALFSARPFFHCSIFMRADMILKSLSRRYYAAANKRGTPLISGTDSGKVADTVSKASFFLPCPWSVNQLVVWGGKCRGGPKEAALFQSNAFQFRFVRTESNRKGLLRFFANLLVSNIEHANKKLQFTLNPHRCAARSIYEFRKLLRGMYLFSTCQNASLAACPEHKTIYFQFSTFFCAKCRISLDVNYLFIHFSSASQSWYTGWLSVLAFLPSVSIHRFRKKF